MIPDVARGACRWQMTLEHSFMTASGRRRDTVRCCHCRTKLPYSDSYVTVAYGHDGHTLPLPVFVHCSVCALTEDATELWMLAYRKDLKASLPDPEKIKRELELNAKMARIPGFENLIEPDPE